MGPPRHRSITTGVAVALGVAIIVIGVRFLVAPAAGASDFGVAADLHSGAYLAAKGLRDVALGVIGLTLLALGHRRAVGWFLSLVAIVPVGDSIIVLLHGGSSAIALGVHGGTAVALVLAGAAFLRQPQDTPAPGARATEPGSGG